MPVALGIEGERSYDIFVAGSVAAGWSAPVVAARSGANKLLIERRGHVGGTSASGLSLLGFHNNNNYERVVGGIAHELVEQLEVAGGSGGYELTPMWHKSLVPVDPVIIKSVIRDLHGRCGR